ncbi:AAA ATPase, putative, partial [Medicago truncatula]
EIDYARKPRTSQIRRVSIRNFKGVPLLDLDIPPAQPSDIDAPCMMLLGENSTGKSTTLQAIALALMGEKMRDRMGAAAEDFLPREDSGWQLDDTVTPEVTIEFDTGEPVRLSIDPIAKRFIGEEHPATILFSFGSRRFFGKDLVRRQAASSLKSLFDPFAKLQHPGRWIQSLGNEDFNALARAMREVLVLQEEDRIERDEEGRLFVRAHGRDSPLEKLSDGYRSLMAMVLDVMRGMLEEWGDLENARGIVLVDEVETHLHPRWKLRVMSALRRAMPNVQFIATTHDPLCLRGMRGGEVQVLIRDGNHQIQVLTGLPDVRGLRAEQLLTSDYFGLSSTADPDVESALERLALPIDARSADANIDQETLRPFRLIGDTPIDQIANEALRRFVEEAASSRQIDRSRVPVPPSLEGPKCLAAREHARATKHFSDKPGEKFTFRAYRQQDVADALNKLFHGKCAYCESSIKAVQPTDVEHFRPKGRVAECPEHPGYWWLAARWDNLLASCIDCNRRRYQEAQQLAYDPLTDEVDGRFNLGKGDAFPILGAKYAVIESDDYNAEDAALIDPTRRNPSDHLMWLQERSLSLVGPRMNGDSPDPYGWHTYRVFGLNRQGLVEL